MIKMANVLQLSIIVAVVGVDDVSLDHTFGMCLLDLSCVGCEEMGIYPMEDGVDLIVGVPVVG